MFIKGYLRLTDADGDGDDDPLPRQQRPALTGVSKLRMALARPMPTTR